MPPTACETFVGHTHLDLLFGWLVGGDLISFLFLARIFLFLLGDGSLQLVVHKVFERVQVSFAFVLVCLERHTHKHHN